MKTFCGYIHEFKNHYRASEGLPEGINAYLKTLRASLGGLRLSLSGLKPRATPTSKVVRELD